MIWIALYLFAILINLKDKEMLKLAGIALFIDLTQRIIPSFDTGMEYVAITALITLYGCLILKVKAWQVIPLLVILICAITANLLALKSYYGGAFTDERLYLDSLYYLSIAEVFILVCTSRRIIDAIDRYFVRSWMLA